MSSEFPASQRVSPRRRFHRPAAESLGAHRQVPVLTGLPRVGEEPERAALEVTKTVDSDRETSGFAIPIARVDGPDKNQPECQQSMAAEQVVASTPDIPESDKVSRVSAIVPATTLGGAQKWAYPVAGTLIACLLVYTAVFGLKPQSREFQGSQTADWHEATPNDDGASAPVAKMARAMPSTNAQESSLSGNTPATLETDSQPFDAPLGEPLGQPIEQEPIEQEVVQRIGESLEQIEGKSTAYELSAMSVETQAPFAAAGSAESVTSGSAIISNVVAPAPTYDAPTYDAQTNNLPTQGVPAGERTLVYPTTNFSNELPAPQAIPQPQTMVAGNPLLAPPILTANAGQRAYGQPNVPNNRQVQTLGQPPLDPSYSRPQMPNYTPLTSGVYGPGQQTTEQVRLNGNIEPFPR